jgi:chaperonin GroES
LEYKDNKHNNLKFLKMKELQPVNQNVLLDISEDNQEQRTASGIIIPDSAKEKQNIAKVVAMSNIENSEIAVGDKVLYKAFSGTETEFEGEKYLLIQYPELLAKIVETDEI